jgi:hypothetical protein
MANMPRLIKRKESLYTTSGAYYQDVELSRNNRHEFMKK